MERLLLAALWGVKRWARYTQFCPELWIVLPSAVEATVAKGKDPPLRLQARLVELSSVGARYTTGQGAWGLLEDLATLREEPPTGEVSDAAPHWEHQDVVIRYPAGTPEAADIAGAWVLHFDGGCRKNHGAGGFVLLDPEGRCHAGAGWYFGLGCPTNNVAEA